MRKNEYHCVSVSNIEVSQLSWSTKQTSLFSFKGKEPLLDDMVKEEITRAFSEYRAFPFFPDHNVIFALQTDQSLDAYHDRFIEMKNDIINAIAGDNYTIQNRLLKNARLSTRIVDGIALTHRALAEIKSAELMGRRFILLKEKGGNPGIYGGEHDPIVVSHVGQGPTWKETPTMYLGLNLFVVLMQELKKNYLNLFDCFKTLLLVEERAIETGFTHVGLITPSIERDLDTIAQSLVRAFQLGGENLEAAIVKEEVRKFSRENRETILAILDARLPGDPYQLDYQINQNGMTFLERLARLYKQKNDPESLHEVVRLLVAASGHDYHEIRNRANIALERIFCPKEYDAPPATCFYNRRPGQNHTFRFKLPATNVTYFVRIYKNSAPHRLTCDKDIDFFDIDLHYDKESDTFTAEVAFDRLGHYDFVVFKKEALLETWLSGRKVSGRINVIPDVRGEIILEIFADIFGHTRAYWKDPHGHTGLVYNENGEVLRLGRFSDITAHIEDLKENYSITAIYLLGVQRRGTNREDWDESATSPSPFSPMSMTEIEPMLGGEEELKKLIQRAHYFDIKIILDIIPHLNRKSSELPETNVVKCYDDRGRLVSRAATDGRYGTWNDGKLLNYRRFEVWTWLVDAILTLIDTFDIDGIRFDSAHAVPIMMQKNNYPFFFGTTRSHEEMVEGTIILNGREDDHFVTTGYYDSSCRDWISVPLHYFIMSCVEKKLAEKKKSFFINIAECFWGREKYLARSGVIPYNSALFKICENIIHGKTDTGEIYHLYQNHYRHVLPEGTEMLGILGNHDERRALNTFGLHGLKAATGLISFLSNMIMDYEGSSEGEGWKVYLDNIYVNWNQFRYASNQGLISFYKELYTLHREKRGRGHLIGTGNAMVAAAAKKVKETIWIGAFNFSENSQTIQLEFSNPALPISDDVFYKIIDPLYSPVTGHYNFYTGRELRVSKLQTIVPYIDRIKYLLLEIIENPAELYDDFLQDSLFRLCTTNQRNVIASNFAFSEIAGHVATVDGFTTFFTQHLAPRFWEWHKDRLFLSLKRAFFYIVKMGLESPQRMLSFFSQLAAAPDDKLSELGAYLVRSNSRGPIVFLSAEAEPFSKSGGLANVVYELPQKLVSMGEEVYVITPRYRTGEPKLIDKMEKALKEYGASYTGKNVRFFLKNQQYEAGVHQAKVDGINYFLLDHHEIFDGLYWGYTAEEKLKRRIGFARAAAELITSFHLHPLFVFTNDAYVGPFLGIVRSDLHYYKNENFKDTAFFHIMHNVGWQYFDSYYRYENGEDQFNIFNLPGWQFESFADPLQRSNINCMASGIRFADKTITVSPSYARQIEISSDGMESILNNVIGISNAINIDYQERRQKKFEALGFVETWYPFFRKEIDKTPDIHRKIAERYPEILESPFFDKTSMDADRYEIVTRMRNKLLLQASRNFTIDPDIILFTMIHRVCEQKGYQLLLEASEGIFKDLKYQGIVGGSVAWGDQQAMDIAHGLKLLHNFYPTQLSVNTHYQDVTVPYLASDVFLMPSLYEPGGISNLEALACGCFVIARATGGLRDTIKPLLTRRHTVEGNGILFADYSAGSLYDAMKRFQRFFNSLDDGMRSRARQSISKGVYSWRNSARQYIDHIYSYKEIIHPELITQPSDLLPVPVQARSRAGRNS